MDELNIDKLLEETSDIKEMTEPIIKEVEQIPVEPPSEDIERRRRRKKDEEEVQPEWQGGEIQNKFWDYSYEKDGAAAHIKTNKLLVKIIGVIGFIVIPIIVLGVLLFKKFDPEKKTDVTEIVRYDEDRISQELGLSFIKSDYYTPRVRVLPEEIVFARADKGFAVVYINNKRAGIFFDGTKYTLYGLSVGDYCGDDFQGLEFKYDQFYMDEVKYHAGRKEYYYLYNTNTSECMIVTLDSKEKTVIELGYFYDYHQILRTVLNE
ncbi:hypothetical protein SAMN06297422_11129 [Lachnospiraceae bacterium]|nr:hypothetical protein SAMN06297422_11129 [Lachnospiraceae bacterium]